MNAVTGSALEDQLGRVARGGTIGLVGAIVSGATGFGVVVSVARGFTPAEAGVFFSASAIFLVLVATSTLGTEAGFARFLMRYEAQGRHGAVRRAVEAGCLPAMGLALVLAAVVAALAGAFGDLVGVGGNGADVLVVLALALPFAVAADLALSVIRAFGRMRTTVVVDRIVRSTLQMVGVLLVVGLDASLVMLAVCWAAAYVASALLAVPLAVVFLRRRLPAPHPPSREGGVARELWAFTGYRGAARVAQVAIQKADIVIVAAVISPTAAAIYTAATRFVAIGQMVTQALQQVMQPRFTAILMSDDRALLHDVHRTVTAWNVLAVWPIYLVVGAAPAAYLAIFGAGYADRDALLVVVVMSLAMLLAVATGPVDTLLLMSGRSGVSLFNAVVALTINVTLCLTLLPVMGLVGAAVAWAAAVAVRCSLAVRQVHRDLAVPVAGREPALAAVVAVACFGLPPAIWSATWSAGGADGWTAYVALLALGTSAYAGALWVLRAHLRLDVLLSALVPRRSRRRGAPLRRLTSTLRRWMPAPVVRGLRRLALGWGMATARLRMEPAFIIAGAQRSGTTTLFRLLAEHPNLVRPTLDKGTGYFDDHHHRGSRWYRAHFPIRAVARAVHRSADPLWTFECSGYYMFHPLAPGRLAAELPHATVVVMLRNPVDRAVSAHGHERARGFESASFADALAAEPKRLGGEVDRLASDERYRSFAHRHHAYLARGEYAGQVAALIEALGRDRVYVMDADAFFLDPQREFAALQKWLGLPVRVPDHVSQWNAGTPEPMSTGWRRQLEHHFEPHDQALAELIGRTPQWRRMERSS